MSLTCSSAVFVTKSTRMRSSTGKPNGRKAAKNSGHPRSIARNIHLPLQYQLDGVVSPGIVFPCGPIAGLFRMQQDLLTDGGVRRQFKIAALFGYDGFVFIAHYGDARPLDGPAATVHDPPADFGRSVAFELNDDCRVVIGAKL